MAENNYNIIKPVESLQNIAQLGTVSRRQQRKRKENKAGKHSSSEEQPQTEAENIPEPDMTGVSEQNSHNIDYRA